MKRKKLLAVIIAVALLLAVGGTTAFAASSASDKFFIADEQAAEMQAKMEEHLAQALADGEITQEQHDKLVESIQNGEKPNFIKAVGGKLHSLGRRGDAPEPTDEQKAEMQANTNPPLTSRQNPISAHDASEGFAG